MSFHKSKQALTTAILSRVDAANTSSSTDLNGKFRTVVNQKNVWHGSLQTIQESKDEAALRSAIAAMPPVLHNELLTHEHAVLGKTNALQLFPMDQLLDRAIRLMFSERGIHSEQFKRILANIDPAYKDSAVAYCSAQPYRMHDFPTPVNQRHFDYMQGLLAQAENALGGSYPSAFCMIHRVFIQNPSLPDPLHRSARAVTPQPQPPAPTGA